jgi:hypothetical protein
LNEQIINLPKQLYLQGEIIPVKIQYSSSDLPIQKCDIRLIGKEKVEFTFQSFTGKKGFQPIWGLLLPSKHFYQETIFLDEPVELVVSGKSHDVAEIEIPLNAIPSYYGENGKVTYFVQVRYESMTRVEKKAEVQILIDTNYQTKKQRDKADIGVGSIVIEHLSPLLINQENSISINTKKIMTPIRLILTGQETVTASGVTINNPVKEVPLGQFFSKEDITDLQMEFIIPSGFQQSFEGLHTRLEYSIEVQSVHLQSRFGIKREKIRTISRIPVRVEVGKQSNQ